jgi:threonine/homoserine/homoserine lactone efflux protein
MLVRGLMAGVAIAAPVGPVNILTASRTLLKGRRSGLVSGLGAATADTIYGSIAGFSISFVIAFLIREERWIRIYGGLLLVGIGVWYFFRKPASMEEQKDNGGAHSDFVSTFLLTLTNPTTVLSFLAVLAALGAASGENWWRTLFLVAGIFAGSMAWWVVLVTVASRFRNRFNDGTLRWMNRIAGFAIGGFGAVTMILGLTTRN